MYFGLGVFQELALDPSWGYVAPASAGVTGLVSNLSIIILKRMYQCGGSHMHPLFFFTLRIASLSFPSYYLIFFNLMTFTGSRHKVPEGRIPYDSLDLQIGFPKPVWGVQIVGLSDWFF